MNIGDYVRTKNGIIGKFEYAYDLHKSLDDTNNYDNEPNIKFEDYKYLISKNQIIKSSPNIIDLIEIGDYVNGMPVLHKENNELVCGLLLRYKEENIENIVTKEQFESMEYKIGE